MYFIIVYVRKIKVIIFIILCYSFSIVNAKDYTNQCLNPLFISGTDFFKSTPIMVLHDPRGVVLRFELKNPIDEFQNITEETTQNILLVRNFLAKIKNPAIIEVHLEDFQNSANTKLKTWEISTVISNHIEALLLMSGDDIQPQQIKSVGYGEFLPSIFLTKNTSYNGGKYLNRVDIIVLCNMNGE